MRNISQGALEYMIIIAAVLSIAAMVTVFLTGALEGRREEALVSECRSAAAQCKQDQLISPETECPQCEVCGELAEIDGYEDAEEHCRAGEPERIGTG